MVLKIDEFLFTEFAENFAHKRHFQTQRHALIGLYFTMVLAIPIILEKVGLTPFYEGLLLVLVFVIGILVFLLLIMNRKYSTVITRQINGIRNYFVSKSQNPDIESIFSKIYLNKNYPLYLNFKSDSFIIFILVGVLNSIAISSGAYFLSYCTFVPLVVLVLSFCLHAIILIRLLR